MAPIWLSKADQLCLSCTGKRPNALKASRNFRESAGNAFYCVAEYIAQPLSMLVVAPFLVHKLGLEQYGIWMFVSAILGSMGILSTGYCSEEPDSWKFRSRMHARVTSTAA